MDKNNCVTVPVYEKNSDGSIVPNMIFHRAFDRVHSRCVEYPFSASFLSEGGIVLDLGSAKSGVNWINFLDSFGATVHCSDYDDWTWKTRNITFSKADIRHLPYHDDTFDTVVAVSVVEHIGLSSPQVNSEIKPKVDMCGDLDAFKEIMRVLKKDGLLIMTVPCGPDDKIVFNGEARSYTPQTIKKFNQYADPQILDYYEYQYRGKEEIFIELNTLRELLERIKRKVLGGESRKVNCCHKDGFDSGATVWRRIPMERSSAKNKSHIDGVLCGVWKKKPSWVQYEK